MGFDGAYFKDFGGAKKNYPLNQVWVQDLFKKALDETGTAIETVQVSSVVEAGQIKKQPDSLEGKAGLEGVKKCAEFCKAVKAERVLLEDFGASSIETREDIKNMGAFLKEAAKIVNDAGLVLSFEPFSAGNVVLDLYERSGCSFTLCYDTANPQVYEFGDALEELPRYLDISGFVSHIHFKDAPKTLKGNVLLGEGVCHYAECVKILKDRGYNGWILTENNYADGKIGGSADPTIAIAKDLATLKRDFL